MTQVNRWVDEWPSCDSVQVDGHRKCSDDELAAERHRSPDDVIAFPVILLDVPSFEFFIEWSFILVVADLGMDFQRWLYGFLPSLTRQQRVENGELFTWFSFFFFSGHDSPRPRVPTVLLSFFWLRFILGGWGGGQVSSDLSVTHHQPTTRGGVFLGPINRFPIIDT